nr:fibronectin type III domain-containing protein [Cryobacterium sp. Y50]
MTATVTVGDRPYGVAVNEETNTVYVANYRGGTVSVIAGASNTVTATVPVGGHPIGVAVNETTNTVYVTNDVGGRVSVIDGASNTVTATVTAGNTPYGVAVNETRNTAYVANYSGGTVSVIAPLQVTVPGAPTGVSATARSGQVSVAFTPPASDGGSVITGYTVTATDTTTPGNGGQTVSGTGSPIVVTGLTSGDSYTFTVTATNTVGAGAASITSSAVSQVKLVVTPTDSSLAITGSPYALPMGLAGLLLISGLAVLGSARLRSQSRTLHVG